ncbi:hypothetical protein MAN88_46750 [Microcystis aeruginosa]|nr:hypothetical protein MAN88_46750 [Microcystis aeruginosa]
MDSTIVFLSKSQKESRQCYSSCLSAGSSRLCVIIFAYGIVKCLLGKTFRTILLIFYQYRPRFHTETRRALCLLVYNLGEGELRNNLQPFS